VFRTSDAELIADYRVSAELSSIESTMDGRSIVLGTVDGCLAVLALADPNGKHDMREYLLSLPSRDAEVSFLLGTMCVCEFLVWISGIDPRIFYFRKPRGTQSDAHRPTSEQRPKWLHSQEELKRVLVARVTSPSLLRSLVRAKVKDIRLVVLLQALQVIQVR